MNYYLKRFAVWYVLFTLLLFFVNFIASAIAMKLGDTLGNYIISTASLITTIGYFVGLWKIDNAILTQYKKRQEQKPMQVAGWRKKFISYSALIMTAMSIFYILIGIILNKDNFIDFGLDLPSLGYDALITVFIVFCLASIFIFLFFYFIQCVILRKKKFVGTQEVEEIKNERKSLFLTVLSIILFPATMLFVNWIIVPTAIALTLKMIFFTKNILLTNNTVFVLDIIFDFIVSFFIMLWAMRWEKIFGLFVATVAAFMGWIIYFSEVGMFQGMLNSMYPLWYELFAFVKYPAAFVTAYMIKKIYYSKN